MRSRWFGCGENVIALTQTPEQGQQIGGELGEAGQAAGEVEAVGVGLQQIRLDAVDGVVQVAFAAPQAGRVPSSRSITGASIAVLRSVVQSSARIAWAEFPWGSFSCTM